MLFNYLYIFEAYFVGRHFLMHVMVLWGHCMLHHTAFQHSWKDSALHRLFLHEKHGSNATFVLVPAAKWSWWWERMASFFFFLNKRLMQEKVLTETVSTAYPLHHLYKTSVWRWCLKISSPLVTATSATCSASVYVCVYKEMNRIPG